MYLHDSLVSVAYGIMIELNSDHTNNFVSNQIVLVYEGIIASRMVFASKVKCCIVRLNIVCLL